MKGPIPLTDPTGTVRSYACRKCGNIATPSFCLGGVDRATAEKAAMEARESAKRCCRCRTCGKEVNLRHGVCDPCFDKWKAEEDAKPAPAPVELCRHHEYVGECDTCDEVAAAVAKLTEALTGIVALASESRHYAPVVEIRNIARAALDGAKEGQ